MEPEDMRIAKPCNESWADMDGDDRSRFCRKCASRVYDFTGMTRPEISRLLEEKEGRVCVRLHRRHDGTVLTRDCPVGAARARRKLAFLVGVTGALASGLLGWFLPGSGAPWTRRSLEPDGISKTPQEQAREDCRFLMGYVGD